MDISGPGQLESCRNWLFTRVARFHYLPPLGGVNRHFLGNCRSRVHEGMSFWEAVRSTNVASFLATVVLDLRGILFKTFFGWFKKLAIASVSTLRPSLPTSVALAGRLGDGEVTA